MVPANGAISIRDLSWPGGSRLGVTKLAIIKQGILAVSFA
jgi:hypothetical protein